MIKPYKFGMSVTVDYLIYSIFKSHENNFTVIAANPRNITYLEDDESWALSGKQNTNRVFGRFFVVVFDASTLKFYVKFFNEEMRASKNLSNMEILIKEDRLTENLKMYSDLLVFSFNKQNKS